jgi:hypothetical protein
MTERSVPRSRGAVHQHIIVTLSLGFVTIKNNCNYCDDKILSVSPFLSRVVERVYETRRVVVVSEESVRQKRQNRYIYYNTLLIHYLYTSFTCDITRAKPVTKCDRTRLGHGTRGRDLHRTSNLSVKGAVQ